MEDGMFTTCHLEARTPALSIQEVNKPHMTTSGWCMCSSFVLTSNCEIMKKWLDGVNETLQYTSE